MLVIREQNSTVKALLAPQEVDFDKQYRLVSFCTVTECDGKKVVYNSLTGEILELSSDEWKLFCRKAFYPDEETFPFVERWFFVPLEHDDIQLADEVREFIKLFKKKEGISSYTIFTTMDCNARCFYCYEMGRPRTPMSAETARDVVEFIDKNAPKKRKVRLNWFGGEPLYNQEVIDIITEGLCGRSIEFEAHITSNGYLFDGEAVSKAKEKWNVKSVQITLDGTEEIYNKYKAFVYKDAKSPFIVVTDNIESLLAAGIKVAIRLNMGAHNKEDLFKLAEWLSARYGVNEKLSVYAHLLFEYNEKGASNEQAKALANDLLDLEAHIIRLGLSVGGTVPKAVKLNCCMADSPNSVTITPTGKLGKCEHFSENEFIGSISDGIKDSEKAAEFAAIGNSKELCEGCSAYPVCIKLKKCPDCPESICDMKDRMIKEKHLEKQVQNTYRKLKQQQKNEAE